MKKRLLGSVLVGIFAALVASSAMAQQTNPRGASVVLDEAARDGKFTFLMFYKQTDSASDAMAATLKKVLADKPDAAVAAFVRVGDPAEQALVAQYDVNRAPMPMTIAIAPNGAMTGIFAGELTAVSVEEAFVTPTMMFVMKNLQAGNIVLVTVQGAANAAAPVALAGFRNDPHFKERLATISLHAADPREAKFVNQMQIAPQTQETQTVLLAPPGVMVGKFDARATKDEIAAALAKASKCCDDPKCKHHQ